MSKKVNISNERKVTLDGLMTLGKLEDNRMVADFECCEDVEIEAFIGRFKVQGIHNGNLYLEELPKRVKNRPMFREDNMSLSHGRDGKWYAVFVLSGEETEELPRKLVQQSSALAQKVLREIICK